MAGFTEAIKGRGSTVYATPGEAWFSQIFPHAWHLALAVSLAVFVLRRRIMSSSAIFKAPVDGVYHPAEFVATLIGLAYFAATIFFSF